MKNFHLKVIDANVKKDIVEIVLDTVNISDVLKIKFLIKLKINVLQNVLLLMNIMKA